MHRRAPIVSFLLAITFTPFLQAKWHYVRSPNFELYTDGAKGNAKDVLNYLEQVRDLFSRINRSEFEPERPVRLVAFNSESAFKKLQDRGESAYAFYFMTRERNYMVFQELDADQMYETAVHEYIHLRVREMGLPLPVWLSEGMAEFYSTVRPQGSTVRMGYMPSIARSVGVDGPLKIEEIMEVTRGDAKFWKNRQKSLSLYARSWALTSLLILHEDYRDKFSDLVLALVAGEKAADVFPDVFGKTLKDVDRDLRQFMGGPTIPIMIFDTKWDREKQQLEKREVGDVESGLLMADLLRRMGKRERAEKEYAKVLKSAPENPDAHAGLARLEFDEEQRGKLFEKSAALGSTSPYLFLDYAAYLLQKEEPDTSAAREALERAAELGPRLADPKLYLAAMDRVAGKHHAAAVHLRTIKNVDWVGKYVLTYWLAQSTAATGSEMQSQVAVQMAAPYVRTEQQFDELHRVLHPDSPSPLVEVDALLDAGDDDAAMEKLLRLRQNFAEAAPLYERIADILERRGDQVRTEQYRAAAVRYRRQAVLEAKQRYTQNYVRIAFCDSAGWHEAAQSFFDTLTGLNPNDWMLFNNRSYSLAERGDLPERAVLLAERATELVPEEERLSVADTLGWAYMNAGRLEEAIEVFEEIVEEEPDRGIYEYHYGYVLAKAGRAEEAIKAYDRVLGNSKLPESLRKKVQEAREEAAGS